ncbi:MAG: hypothetical protein HYW79_02285 [Parcubacteria group bacterium]|nr:hypothetical protein [Parcubacteria group bacterium]
MSDISKKTFIWAITGLIILRVVLMILMMNNIPFTGMTAGGFRPTFTESYQPDELQYFKLTEGLIASRAEKLVPNIGTSIIFAPFIYFTGASSPDELAKSVFVFEAFVLFSLALILVVLIAEKLFNSRKLAVVSAASFVVYPWVLLLIFNLLGYKNAVPAFHYQLWIFILSDYLSAFWVYLGFFLIFKWFNNIFESSTINWKELIILAVVSGAAILTRMGNFWLILIIFSTFLYYRNFKKLIFYGFFLSIAYLPQLVFNAIAFGAPWIFGYRDPKVGASTSSTPLAQWFNPENLWLNFSKFSPQHYFLLFLIAAAFFILIFCFGYKYFSKMNGKFALVTGAWFWSYLIFYWIFDESLSQLRYFLPMVPIFIYFFVAAMIYLAGKFKGKIYV